MRKRICHLLVPLFFLAPAADADVAVSASEWARPRHGQAITQLPGLRGLILDTLAAPDGRVLVHYPGGEEGMLWAEELRSWLVALGIDSARIELLPGTSAPDALVLSVPNPPD